MSQMSREQFEAAIKAYRDAHEKRLRAYLAPHSAMKDAEYNKLVDAEAASKQALLAAWDAMEQQRSEAQQRCDRGGWETVNGERWQDTYRALRDADPEAFRRAVQQADGWRLRFGLTMEQGAGIEESLVRDALYRHKTALLFPVHPEGR